ncbi:MFS transporter [Pantoea dispersa]|uniref:MFS transporter n=1 Tax=Pantoea dispersa TaxID=59814 RepID=UPI0021F6EA1E|nr:MFS transporter [Pantoea dispersa]MCW0320854.1 putative MFS-type transporter YhhS [Pantoea dispersa]MCW0325590.1 putative MFS-type transporter YhhS [Pantoea dispersa]MCW0430681.1 putative MFS-type transporter YhhS [Pantoea dispersa]
MSDAAVLSNAQLNKRILSVIVFTFFCYLSVGLPLAVLPGFVHNQLGFSSFIAGLIISLQYFATLLSRPHSGRLADRYGPKRVVMMGLACCGMSGVLSIIAALCSGAPLLSLTLLALGRLFLGVGESFSSTGSTLWGMNIVGPRQTARVISWNGVATYFAMAIGAPLGVLLNQIFGISGFAGLVALMGAIGFWMASGKPAVSVSAGMRIPFHRVVSRVWLFGLALGFGTIGFGVISTFITLYFASRDWSGAAFALTLFSLGFVLVRLACGRYITRFGGLQVSLISFVLEGAGLLLIWQADSSWLVDIGAFLTGGGFSLVFPALGVEAVKRVQQQDQGSALGTYSAFLDLGLGLTGPVAGLLIGHWGMQSVYLAAALMVLGAFLITLRLHQQSSEPIRPDE